MKIDSIDATRMGYGMIYLPFSIDIPDDRYWSYDNAEKNYAILVEAVLKFKEICEKQKESIEKKKQIINNFYGYSGSNDSSDIYNEAVRAFEEYGNYGTRSNAHTRAFKDFVTIWEDNKSSPVPETLSEYERSYNSKTDSENNKEKNETTAFTSGEISW